MLVVAGEQIGEANQVALLQEYELPGTVEVAVPASAKEGGTIVARPRFQDALPFRM